MKSTAAQFYEAVQLLKHPRKAARWVTSCEDAGEASQRCFAIAAAIQARKQPLEAAIFILKTWVGQKDEPEMRLVLRLLKEANANRD